MKTLFAAIILASFCLPAMGQKLTAEEIIAKHLDSIATKSVRSSMVDVSMLGDASFSTGPEDRPAVSGKGVIASTHEKMAFAMTFPFPNYPMEKIIFDGKLHVASPNMGNRSAFGDFLSSNDGLISEGLLLGALSYRWSMSALKGRVSSKGTKTIDGREAYAISYEAKKGLGMTTNLYFDKETFRHVRTEYFRTIGAQIGFAGPESSARQSDSQERLVEEFEDFKTENGVTLPRNYRITLYLQRGGATAREYRYKFVFTNYYYNQNLDPATFSK